MYQDLRHGFTMLRRDSGISALIILVLALGIGGNAAIFTLFKSAFLDPLPYPNADRLVTVVRRVTNPRDGGSIVSTSNPKLPEFLEIQERSRTLEQMAFLETRDFQLVGANEPMHVFSARVTASFFPLLGVKAAIGRTFSLEENSQGRHQVLMVSNDFWRARMGADPGAVGRTLRLDGAPYQVVGVLPQGFRFDYPSLGIPEPVEVYVPVVMENVADSVLVLGRLRARSSLAQAEAELGAIAQTLATPIRTVSGNPRDASIRPVPLQEAIAGSQRPVLMLLTGGAGLLLVMACANTVQLLLARSLRRAREMSIRTSLGASRVRLIRQLLTEGFVLAACGNVAGLLVANVMVRLLVRFFPARLPLFESAHVDVQVMAFSMALSAISAIVFAIIPALKGTARTTIGKSNRWRHLMIAVEAALSVFLLCGAALIAQNLWTLISMPTGFDPNHVVILQLRLPGQREQTSAAYQEYLDRISAIPGVDAAAASTAIPLRPWRGGFFRMAGEPEDVLATRPPTWGYNVSPDYFRALKIPIIAGRTFRNEDTAGRPLVAIVNEEFVRAHGIGPDPIGRQIDDGPGGFITIVGVAANVRLRGIQALPASQFYTSYLQYFQPTSMYFIVRSSVEPKQLVARMKEAIRSSYPEQPVFNISTMAEVFSNSIARPRFNAYLLGAFALLASIMAASGMYSVISCLVSQRTTEIAIRIALGATRAAVIRTVLGTASAWVAGGLAGGIAIGLVASNTIRSLSNSVVPASPATYAAVALFFLVVNLAATCFPVRRACLLDPALAIRGPYV